jgi:predicted 3-demethylubiquinone-9 3-methyltransferase (glyoxalase superfamily)
MQKITPFLWFDDKAEEAVNFYLSIFRNSKILSENRYETENPRSPGTVLTINFIIDGQEFIALNGGPHFKFTEAVSFVVNCETQAEIDRFWEKLSEGGQEQQCGWLKDKYGLSWQIVPTNIGELLNPGDPAKSQNVQNALFKMFKIDIETLKQAGKGE